MTEPYYDEDTVNLGYLKKILKQDEESKQATGNVSKHYGSRPTPPYSAGDTYNIGSIIYTCINSRLIGEYVEADWVSESGALKEATYKSKTYLTQPTNYKMGDTWILQTDDDHEAGKKGEILTASKNGSAYVAEDWVKQLTYITQDEKLEIDKELETAKTNIANLQTTSGEISARVESAEIQLTEGMYNKEQIEAMNESLVENINEAIRQQTNLSENISETLGAEIELLKANYSELKVQSDNVSASVTKIINENGDVVEIKNTTVTIDATGVTIGSTENDKFYQKSDLTGNHMYSYGELVADYTKDGANIPVLKCENEAILNNLRIIPVLVSNVKHTHIHWVG